jgi:4-alpha-glucanotransferase
LSANDLSRFPRRSGILLHPTSLPGRFGIGDLGPEAYRFADFLIGSGQRLWQVLPLGPTGMANSPYMCLSAFAGNPLLISPDLLVEQGLLDSEYLANIPVFPSTEVDYDSVAVYKNKLLDHSFAIFEKSGWASLRDRFDAFCRRNASWLDEFALFMALREDHHFQSWNNWENDIRKRDPAAISRWRKTLERDIRQHQYCQFLFFEQWLQLKNYCSQHGIQLIGDIPIFIALDSDSVWAHPELFYLDEQGHPTAVAGVPPDYFSETGQLWNSPLYRWDAMSQDGYHWWVRRFQSARTFFDIIRIDHFRGFEKYWEIPGHSKTAVNGRWVVGPGAGFFETVIRALGDLPIIAEDLGIITPEVIQLRDRFNFPGMKVLQFAFSSGLASEPYLPHNYPRNCVVYTGTHDNDTVIGWFRGDYATTLDTITRAREHRHVLDYLGSDGTEINWDLVRLALMSVADTAIFPLQDILGLGSEARMNTPGTTLGNWGWRLTGGMLNKDIQKRLGEMTNLYGRSINLA